MEGVWLGFKCLCSIRSPVSVQAEVFYQEWRFPSNSRDWREALQIKRSDSSRGFERVGR